MERAEHWPERVQDEAIASLQSIETELLGLYELSYDDRAALERGGEDVQHGGGRGKGAVTKPAA